MYKGRGKRWRAAARAAPQQQQQRLQGQLLLDVLRGWTEASLLALLLLICHKTPRPRRLRLAWHGRALTCTGATAGKVGGAAVQECAVCAHVYGVPVSYTHLTLPTNREVEILVVVAS